MSAFRAKVSVVLITYERFELLERTLLTFRQNTNYPNLEVIITDDGSSAQTLRKIERLAIDKLIVASRSKSGLGANANRGIRAASGDFILHLQDDFDCHGPSDYLDRAIAAFNAHSEVGIVRFCGVNADQHRWTEADHDGFSLLQRPSGSVLAAQQLYADLPHLKSRKFVEQVGEYREGCGMEQTEADYVQRFLRQHECEIGFFPDLNGGLFEHTGAALSFRTSNLRYRAQERLASLATPLKTSTPGLHRAGRALWRRISG
ncbi:MAG: glycosyltransferase [Acidobacteriaceae bacterium]